MGIWDLGSGFSSQAVLDQIIGQIADSSAGEDLSAKGIGKAGAAGKGRPQGIEEVKALEDLSLQDVAPGCQVGTLLQPSGDNLLSAVEKLHGKVPALDLNYSRGIGSHEGEPGLLPRLLYRLQEVRIPPAPEGQVKG